jgi:hypothetical protein
MRIPYVVTVDTEEEWDWPSGYPTRGLTVRNVEQLRRYQDLAERFGVATTYLVDHAVMADPRGRETILALSERPRVEIGMHIHPWNTPPLDDRPWAPRHETYLANLTVPLIEEKLATTYEALSRSGLQPTSFRGGRYSTNAVVRRFLRDHGFVVDSSILPYSSWPEEEGSPDFRQVGFEPVRHPPRHPGDRAFWELPLTVSYTRNPVRFWNAAYQAIRSSPLRHLRLIGIADRLNLVSRVWLNLEGPDGAKIDVYLKRILAGKQSAPYLCFSFHSSSLLVGGSNYAPTPGHVERIYQRIESTFERLAGSPAFQPATLTEISEILETAACASSA